MEQILTTVAYIAAFIFVLWILVTPDGLEDPDIGGGKFLGVLLGIAILGAVVASIVILLPYILLFLAWILGILIAAIVLFALFRIVRSRAFRLAWKAMFRAFGVLSRRLLSALRMLWSRSLGVLRAIIKLCKHVSPSTLDVLDRVLTTFTHVTYKAMAFLGGALRFFVQFPTSFVRFITRRVFSSRSSQDGVSDRAHARKSAHTKSETYDSAASDASKNHAHQERREGIFSKENFSRVLSISPAEMPGSDGSRSGANEGRSSERGRLSHALLQMRRVPGALYRGVKRLVRLAWMRSRSMFTRHSSPNFSERQAVSSIEFFSGVESIIVGTRWKLQL